MTIIEIRNGLYLNFENVFKFEIRKNENDNRCFFRFFNDNETYADSQEFESMDFAREWISMRIIRAAGADEVLGL